MNGLNNNEIKQGFYSMYNSITGGGFKMNNELEKELKEIAK